MRKYLPTLFVLLSILVFSNTAFASQIMLFVLEGCPHCANVEKYMEDNQIASKLDIKTYELSDNIENQALYDQKAYELGYTGGRVPFLVDGARYFVGNTTIISYMEQKTTPNEGNIQVEVQSITPKTLSEESQNQLKDILKESDSAADFSKYITEAGLLVIMGLGATLLIKIKRK